jgi:hypothetical protein
MLVAFGHLRYLKEKTEGMSLSIFFSHIDELHRAISRPASGLALVISA